MGERVRGRRGVELRRRRLAAEPLCRMCKAEGITRIADEIDHIRALSIGGEDVDDNCQALCADHHRVKSAAEGARSFAVATHPDWLDPSAIPVTIVCGPPCSGKTTFINDRAEPGDIRIDLDTIQQQLQPEYKHWHGRRDEVLLNRAMRQRNAILGSLSRMQHGRAWFIVHAPTQDERDWWQSKLGGDVVLLHPGVEECKRRAIERGTPLAVEGVQEWERLSALPWKADGSHKRRRQAIGVDGWPIEQV